MLASLSFDTLQIPYSGRAHVGRDGAQQMHVLLAEAVLLLGALYADDAQDTIANGDGHAQVGLGRQAHHGLAQLDRAARHILVDQQRLPHAEDVRREPSPKRDGRHFFTECVGEADEVRLRVVQRHINDVRRESLAYLFPHQVDQGIRLQLGGECLADAVDRCQLLSRAARSP